eukprot:scaffold27675_cov85-Phaeocystis_antarctica.AAC.4
MAAAAPPPPPLVESYRRKQQNMRPENAPETTHIGKQGEDCVLYQVSQSVTTTLLYRVHFTNTECFTITTLR